jgi:hypothetical protein
MAVVDDLLAYVNLELPRRIVRLSTTVAGYDGDPNDGSAPAILQGSPDGTYYQQETPRGLWRKDGSGAADWIKVDLADLSGSTLENLTFPVDLLGADCGRPNYRGISDPGAS